MSLPSETYRTEHSPKLAYTEDGIIYLDSGVDQLLGVSQRFERCQPMAHIRLIESCSLWKYPLATFDFAKDDERFPIDIEIPFETFQTVLWEMRMVCPVTLSTFYNPDERLAPIQKGRRVISKGIERVSHLQNSQSALLSQ